MPQRIDERLARIPFGLLALATIGVLYLLGTTLRAVIGLGDTANVTVAIICVIGVQLLFAHAARRPKSTS